MNNSKKQIALIGGGGHGKVCASIAEELGYTVVFFDDAFPEVGTCGKWPIIGTKKDLIARIEQFDFSFVAIGNCEIRERIQNELVAAGFNIANLISTTASVHSSIKLGKGILIVGNACINIGSSIGDGAIINTNAAVDHDCQISAFAHICPNVALAGEVFVGELTWVGIGSSVIQQLKLGAGSMIGAGSAVINDVPVNTKVAGCPAKPI
ncbi:acetyltransferase [Thalassotalea nanhaiensis]|uniref:Acetyltransferase n=1 Tax=Thalassotalea nanhaiensis TaxID=3065648 RepID=A0ABY9TLP7_9GAMM|nr:acetyltransferase [Colwelliaceae bacterium SQ345]